ncbi:cellulose binding domain-containing protein [Thermomonospora echinospora]|uniref:cellulose binding domain-containing protein n=1 Tax=Thermomonospora echinospora TaxID=1992 RepID=UPI000CDEC15A|nr:cellulose binding domain-containing protein [Thermomonospora echinospora]
MSADEPGYVPPDHKTTAEFRVPGGPSAADATEPEATLVDRPLPDDRDELDETVTDPVRQTAAPATATDLTMDDPEDVRALAADDIPGGLPADDVPPSPPAATAPQSPSAEDPADGPEGRAAAVAGGAAGHQAEGPGEWTEQFGREESRRHAPTAPHPGLAAAAAGPLAAAAVPPGAKPARPDVPQESPQPGPPPGGPQGGPSQDAATPPVGTPAGPVPPPGQLGQFGQSGQPAGLPGPPSAGRARRGPRTALLVAAAVLLVTGVLGAALLLALMPDDDDRAVGSTAPNPTASGGAPASPGPGGSGVPTPGPSGPGTTPAPSGPPQQGTGQPPGQGVPSPAPPPREPIGPVVEGDGLTYQLVQRDPGYYEGLLIITNRGNRPMKEWKLTFRTHGANVKNVWGGELVRGGERVEIRNLDGAPAIPPGATWEVRFGAEGAPAAPKGCRLNDRGCGL